MPARKNLSSSSNIRIKPSKKHELRQETSSSKSDATSDWYARLGDDWTPTPNTVFKLLLSARFCAALWNGISDCDETFNYWEPAHFLFQGKGFQTWEYSPAYAIRSYAYVLLHVLPMKFLSLLLSGNNVLMFFSTRCVLGLCCTLTETMFYRGICLAFGGRVGRVTLIMQLFSAGMFISATAFIPSSFSMYLTMLAIGAWLQGFLNVAILSIAASAIIGWPFAGILGLPIAVSAIFIEKKVVYFIKWCFIALFAFLIPLVAVDAHFYSKVVVAPLNIVLYNVFSGHGPEIYGVEPVSYYLKNGLLNMNLAFPMALLSLPILTVTSLILKEKMSEVMKTALTLLPLYAWILIFFTRPHKEERFLFPIYPLITLAAALVLDHGQRLLQAMASKMKRKQSEVPSWPTAVFSIMFILLSLSRIVALHQAYHAPMDIYVELYRLGTDDENRPQVQDAPINVCVGKEWHRFASSFFLPGPSWHLRFLQSEFKGQLPKPYDAGEDATSKIPSHMNDLNKEEPSRYFDVKQCHYLIDLDSDDWTRLEPRYSDSPDWTVVKQVPFLDAKRSHWLYRAFYIPFVSDQHCQYTMYNLLKSKRPGRAKSKSS